MKQLSTHSPLRLNRGQLLLHSGSYILTSQEYRCQHCRLFDYSARVLVNWSNLRVFIHVKSLLTVKAPTTSVLATARMPHLGHAYQHKAIRRAFVLTRRRNS